MTEQDNSKLFDRSIMWFKHHKRGVGISMLLFGLYLLAWSTLAWWSWQDFRSEHRILRLFKSDMSYRDRDMYVILYGNLNDDKMTVNTMTTLIKKHYLPFYRIDEVRPITSVEFGMGIEPQVAKMLLGPDNQVAPYTSLQEVSNVLPGAGIIIILLFTFAMVLIFSSIGFVGIV